MTMDSSEEDSSLCSTHYSTKHLWLDIIKEWYPSLHTRTYFVPPRVMDRTKSKQKGGEFSVSHSETGLRTAVDSSGKSVDPEHAHSENSISTELSEPLGLLLSLHGDARALRGQENETRFSNGYLGTHENTSPMLQHDTEQDIVCHSTADVPVSSQSVRRNASAMSTFRLHEDSYLENQTDTTLENTVNMLPAHSASRMQDSDIRDDQTQQLVLNSLQHQSNLKKEPMVVISQLNFRNYMNNPEFEAVASTLPKPRDLKGENKHRGDFDILIIHRRHGILVGEIKSVGNNFSDLSMPEEAQDSKVSQRTKQSIKQLYKAEYVLKHLVSDLISFPRVTKTLMLPNIPREQLKRVLQSEPQLKRELCVCLDLGEYADPSGVCFTSDDVPEPTSWWSELAEMAGTDDNMTEDVYLQLVARFAGPATIMPCSQPAEPGKVQPAECYPIAEATAYSETATRPRSPRAGSKEIRTRKKHLQVQSETDVLNHKGPLHTGHSPANCEQCGKELGYLLLQKLHKVDFGTSVSPSHWFHQYQPLNVNIVVSGCASAQGQNRFQLPAPEQFGIIRGLTQQCTPALPTIHCSAGQPPQPFGPHGHIFVVDAGRVTFQKCMQVEIRATFGWHHQQMYVAKKAEVLMRPSFVEVHWI